VIAYLGIDEYQLAADFRGDADGVCIGAGGALAGYQGFGYRAG